MPRLLQARNREHCSEQTAGKRRDRHLSAMRPIPRRGLSRLEAAIYFGIGLTKFDALVDQGVIPKPKRIDGRRIWDIFELDLAFDRLSDENSPPDETWDDVDATKAPTVR